MWEFGTPAKGSGWNSAASGANCWITGLKDNYQPGMTEILRIPTLTEFDTTVAAELRFKHKFDFAPSDGGAIEYFQNGNIKEEGSYSVFENRDGIWKDYFINGKLKNRLLYKNGKLVMCVDIDGYEIECVE